MKSRSSETRSASASKAAQSRIKSGTQQGFKFRRGNKINIYMKIGTYNVRVDMPPDWLRGNGWWFKRQPKVIKKIKDANLDILAMQEVKHWFQLWSLSLFMPGYSSHSIGRDSSKTGIFGERLGIWWKTERFDLLSKYHFFFSETPEKSSIGWDGKYKDLCVVVRLQDKFTNEIFNVFCAHLDPCGYDAKMKGMDLLLEKMQQADQNETIIMLGDLNICPSFPAYANAIAKYNDVYFLTPNKTETFENTYTGFKPLTVSSEGGRGDMIFINKTTVKSYTNDYDFVASDHNMVICEI